MDLSKEFGKVNREKIRCGLYDKGAPVKIIRMVIIWKKGSELRGNIRVPIGEIGNNIGNSLGRPLRRRIVQYIPTTWWILPHFIKRKGCEINRIWIRNQLTEANCGKYKTDRKYPEENRDGNIECAKTVGWRNYSRFYWLSNVCRRRNYWLQQCRRLNW